MRDGSRERDGRADGRSEAERGIEREGEQEVARHLRPFHEISADPPASLSLPLSLSLTSRPYKIRNSPPPVFTLHQTT